jgi:hypothetical protein
MRTTALPPPPETFSPALRADDPLAAYWLRNVTLRLRREICWLWRERGISAAHAGERGFALPPFTDRLESSLDLSRHAIEKHRFFSEDETASYLSRAIGEAPPANRDAARRGSFSWLARELALSDLDCFVLALAISPVVDSAAGPVYAACLNDPARQWPTLGLAQRLWDQPKQLFALANPAHPLFTHGLLSGATGTLPAWEAPLQTHALIAETLIHPRRDGLPGVLRAIAPDHDSRPDEAAIAAARLRSADARRLRLQPVLGGSGAPLAGVAAALGAAAGLNVVALEGAPAGPANEAWLAAALTLAWLHGVALYAGLDAVTPPGGDTHGAAAPAPLPLPSLPITIFVGLHQRALLKRLPPSHTLPPVNVPPSTYRQRLEWWQAQLPGARSDTALAAAAAEMSRRFRYEKNAIAGICRDLCSLDRPIRPADLLGACRADLDLGDLAQPVTPRFAASDLMLPPKQAQQLDEIIRAMQALTTVHYEWGTERVWNESGLTALFAGPPGTGKTMCAEVIAAALQLPLYRIDLSQVVNKYIGETEKNLRRLFDAAEASDVILFFDEADSLFGRRTEVKDAHDRYANLEVSYLLERMERFKGLAILATNRKKDLDEAFLRRLRFLIDFPLPGADERLRIWKHVMPEGIDVSAIDFTFLAQRFPLAGGHIRSIVFHACLQAAQPGGPRKLDMATVITAVKREYDKLDRSMSLEQYGAYAPIAARLA